MLQGLQGSCLQCIEISVPLRHDRGIQGDSPGGVEDDGTDPVWVVDRQVKCDPASQRLPFDGDLVQLQVIHDFEHLEGELSQPIDRILRGAIGEGGGG